MEGQLSQRHVQPFVLESPKLHKVWAAELRWGLPAVRHMSWLGGAKLEVPDDGGALAEAQPVPAPHAPGSSQRMAVAPPSLVATSSWSPSCR